MRSSSTGRSNGTVAQNKNRNASARGAGERVNKMELVGLSDKSADVTFYMRSGQKIELHGACFVQAAESGLLLQFALDDESSVWIAASEVEGYRIKTRPPVAVGGLGHSGLRI